MSLVQTTNYINQILKQIQTIFQANIWPLKGNFPPTSCRGSIKQTYPLSQLFPHAKRKNLLIVKVVLLAYCSEKWKRVICSFGWKERGLVEVPCDLNSNFRHGNKTWIHLFFGRGVIVLDKDYRTARAQAQAGGLV